METWIVGIVKGKTGKDLTEETNDLISAPAGPSQRSEPGFCATVVDQQIGLRGKGGRQTCQHAFNANYWHLHGIFLDRPSAIRLPARSGLA